MYKLALIVFCLLMSPGLFAQGNGSEKKLKGKKDLHKSTYLGKGMIYGSVRTSRNAPVPNVLVFAYAGDTIVASANTNQAGYYETNGMPQGTYMVKVVYPNNKIEFINFVPVNRNEDTPLSLKQDVPSDDVSVNYQDLNKPETAEQHSTADPDQKKDNKPSKKGTTSN
jgi:Carboxypeptidase regulatory-like domain